MSLTLINSIVQDTEYLVDTGDQLLATSAGALIEDNGLSCVQVNGSGSHTITVDGLFYSENGENADAVELFGGSTRLVVNGQVEGDTGVDVSEEFDPTSSNFISVGNQGSIVGLAGDGVFFDGNSSGATNNTINNNGEISATATAIATAGDGGDLVTNHGTIEGLVGIGFSANVATETVNNTGTIEGGNALNSAAISSSGSSAGIGIINTGTITDGSKSPIATAANGDLAVLFFHDNAGTTSTIDNEGTIAGSGYVIQSLSDILDISNSGTIHGGFYSTASADIDNSGLWKGQAGSAVTVLDLAHNGDVVINAHSGKIDGGIKVANGGDTVTNAGSIDGSFAFTGTGTGRSTLTNTGSITGNVNMVVADNLVNHGQIHGNVVAGNSDILTNTGTIHGAVTLGVADTFNFSTGHVTGAVTGSAGGKDIFEFTGNFGNETIGKFVDGTGTTHDTIQFASNDFSTFAQVHAASTQQGSDVVIRLDAADSITLTGATLASLVAADFKFV